MSSSASLSSSTSSSSVPPAASAAASNPFIAYDLRGDESNSYASLAVGTVELDPALRIDKLREAVFAAARVFLPERYSHLALGVYPPGSSSDVLSDHSLARDPEDPISSLLPAPEERDRNKRRIVIVARAPERLSKLPRFPDESFPILTRRPAAEPTSSLAPSPSPLSVADIVADNPLPSTRKKDRKSRPIQQELRFSDTTIVDDFPSYLPFMNRRVQCNECVECFRQQFDSLQSGSEMVTEDNALKNYEVVVSAGGPGIGQSCSTSYVCFPISCSRAVLLLSTHQLTVCYVCVCVLYACLGKTTWARFAFARSADDAQTQVDSPFLSSLEYSRQRQAMYRLLYDDVMVDWEPSAAEKSIAGRLLHQFLKHRLPEGRRRWQQFASHYHLQLCTDLTLQRVAEVIVPLAGRSAIKRRVIVINFDEVADVLSLERRRTLFSAVLRQLAISSRVDSGCYFCVVLTSTEALRVFELPRSSGLRYKSIQLPLLSVDHMYEVVKRITLLSVEQVGTLSSLFPSDIASLLLSSEPHPPLRAHPKLRYFTYLLELLAGVPRFLEKALFRMGSERVEGPFRPEAFLSTLEKVSDPHYLSHVLLSEVVQSIQTKYSGFKKKLDELEVFPLLVTCSLFRAPVRRSQSICYDLVKFQGTRINNAVHSIQQLEDSGVIFLVKSDLQHTKTLPPKDSRHRVRPLSSSASHQSSPFLRPWLTEADPDDRTSFAMVIPFIWIHLVVKDDLHLNTPLPQVQLLFHLSWSLTPSEKERLSLSVVALRLHFTSSVCKKEKR